MAGWSAISAMRARAPIRAPPSRRTSTRSSPGRCPMPTKWAGATARLLINCTRSVPPARNAAPGFPARATASVASLALVYSSDGMIRTSLNDSQRRPDCGHDVGVRTTAAEISAQALPDGVVRERCPVQQQANGGDDLPRRAVATLKGVMGHEREPQRTKRFVLSDSLDGRDAGAVRRDRRHQTSVRRSSLYQDSAGSAPSGPPTSLVARSPQL